MSSRIKPIEDPNDRKGGALIEMPSNMKMRDIQPCEARPDGNVTNMECLDSKVTEDMIKGMPRISRGGAPIDCIKLSEQVLDAIDSIDGHKGFTIGKDSNRTYCGHTIQIIPKGGYARIGGGQSVFSVKPPVEKGNKMTFKFDKPATTGHKSW